MTMTEGLALEITVLTPVEAAAIWKRQSKRAPNFASYLEFINAHDVGASWNTKVPHGDKNAENAKEIKHNFNEAAKERTIPNPDGSGDRVAAPVLIRWKANTRKVQREVTDAKGKKGSVEVVVIDSLDALIVATESVTKRGPRAITEEVTVVNPPADAKPGKTVDLPDGRKATLSKAGKWRAPKLDTANGAVVPNGTTAPSTSSGASVASTAAAT